MSVSFDVLSFINSIGVIQGLFLSLLVFRKKSNNSANIYLALLMLFYSVAIFYGVLIPTNLIYFFPHLFLIGMPFQCLLAPVLYFYVRKLINKGYNLRLKELFHFLPFIIALFLLIPVFIKSGDEKISLSLRFMKGNSFEDYVGYLIWFFFQVQMWVYLFYIWKAVSQHQKNIKKEFSSVDKINLSWIKFFIILCVIVYVLFFLISISAILSQNNFYIERIVPLIVAITIYGLGYRGLSQPEILNASEINDNSKKYATSRLTEKDLHTYKTIIDKVISEDELYQNPEFTLNELAKKVQLDKNNVSRIINDCYKKNFYDFVNSYRLNKVLELMQKKENKRCSIIELAFEAGFNSKSTFNSFFKKNTGFTPSQYLSKIS